jgi:hypothetical protein
VDNSGLPGWALLVVGTGPVAGKVRRTRSAESMTAADVFLLPSMREDAAQVVA